MSAKAVIARYLLSPLAQRPIELVVVVVVVLVLVQVDTEPRA